MRELGRITLLIAGEAIRPLVGVAAAASGRAAA